MYITKLTLKDGIKKLYEYDVHRDVYKYFFINERNFLYRNNMAENKTVYVTSVCEPLYDIIDKANKWNYIVKNFEPNFTNGQNLKFILRANPTIKFNGSRHDIIMHAKTINECATNESLIYNKSLEWLKNKGENTGFEPIDIFIKHYDQIKIYKRNTQPITLSTVDYDGVLKITDADIFYTTLKSGIGSGKGFGCGMFMVRK